MEVIIMGLYYTLSNGEEIEIRINETESYTKELQILLFNGSTILTYKLDTIITLNDIIKEVEKQYNNLFIEDKNFEYSCWCD